MLKSVTLDDMTIVKLMGATSLHSQFPKLEALNRKFNEPEKLEKSCNCRKSSSNRSSVIKEAKDYLLAIPTNKRSIIMEFLNTEHVRISTKDFAGRRDTITW